LLKNFYICRMSSSKFELIKAAINAATAALPSVTFGGMSFKLRPFKMEALLWSESMSLGKSIAGDRGDNVEGALTFYVAVARLLLNEDGTAAFSSREDIEFFIDAAQSLPDEYGVLYDQCGLKAYIESITPSKSGPKLTESEATEKN